MEVVADLHIHSHFSRATSSDLTFGSLARWAQLKGVHIVGTGDISHPGWLAEMREQLVPAEEGLFRLRDDLAAAVQEQAPPACRAAVRFMLGGEISNIYKRDGRTRKVHNVVYVPSFEAAERLQARLERIGNIRSDGRPILGLDARDLLEIVLETGPGCHLIPAHIWTPWFSLLGSKSGFDSVEECFADLTPHIFSLETGLSSDPPMNWRVSGLDRYTLVSNSDAHSAEKLGREATLFEIEPAYHAVFDALQSAAPPSPLPARQQAGGAGGYLGTIEFFPEEGKYHFDGHRACGIVWDPRTTLAHEGLCPVCGKEVTIGVMHRVETLADRPAGSRPAHAHPFHSLVPLPELLGEANGVGASARQVQAEYARLLARLGPELAILRGTPLAAIAAAGGERLAEGIGRMRRGEVDARPGYDGEYGVIRVFAGPGRVAESQMGLWGAEDAGGEDDTAALPDAAPVRPEPPSMDRPVDSSPSVARVDHASRITFQAPGPLAGLNEDQRAAALCVDAPLIISAGPGTGKTRTLTARIAHLILEKGVPPDQVLAITFTNKAAGEMRERLAGMLGDRLAEQVTVKTFHAFGAQLLREHAGRLGLAPDFAILAEEDRAALLRRACPELTPGQVETHLARISEVKCRGDALPGEPPATGSRAAGSWPPPGSSPPTDDSPALEAARVFAAYEDARRAAGAVDFDDLILLPLRLLETHVDLLAAVRARYRWISVDEYQDVNQAQVRLLRLLASSSLRAGTEEGAGDSGRAPNLCVIGDPDQAIYGFRGADRRYFLQFRQDYPGAVSLSLHRNYRSSQTILDAAMQVIARSAAGGAGAAQRPEGSAAPGAGHPSPPPAPHLQAAQEAAGLAADVKLDVQRAATDRAEAETVVHQIEQMVGGTSYFSLDSGRVAGETPPAARSFADFAVLYRLSAQSRLLAEAFDRSGIPYQTVGQQPLTGHAVVREALAHLWLLRNPRSAVHLEAVLAAGRPAFDAQAVERIRQCGGAGSPEAAALQGLTAAQRARLASLSAFCAELARDRAEPVARRIERIAAFIAESRGKPFAGADEERLRQLALRAAPFGDRLTDFLESVVLQSETDAYDPRADRVALMSLHASKGLEFPVVFIVGCEEGLLPYARPGALPDVEEERRLFYVGLTRGRQKVILTWAGRRMLFGRRMENPVSRFVQDIEAALKEVRESERRPPERKPEGEQLSLF